MTADPALQVARGPIDAAVRDELLRLARCVDQRPGDPRTVLPPGLGARAGVLLEGLGALDARTALIQAAALGEAPPPIEYEG